MQIEQDSAQVRIPPPLISLSCVLLGAGLHWIYPLHLAAGSLRWLIAGLLIFTGVAVILYCAWTFRKRGTNIEPWKKTSHLITSGIYRISRNPIYSSFVIVGLGLAFAVNSIWIVLMMVPLVLIINRIVIAKEERYLEEKFGDVYFSYKEKVRKWI
jgi:protein-S-isoprenylcysteine O-methyltransferase Ste14